MGMELTKIDKINEFEQKYIDFNAAKHHIAKSAFEKTSLS